MNRLDKDKSILWLYRKLYGCNVISTVREPRKLINLCDYIYKTKLNIK